MTAYFVSDIHLKSPDEPSAKTFVTFLRALVRPDSSGEKATHLFLVGDIFDLWVGGHTYFRERFPAVVEAIGELVRSGVEVHFFEGNHDLHLENFWQDEIGAHVHVNGARFTLGGLVVRVEHGDLINPDDKGYLFLRRLLRSAPVKALALHLPALLVREIGERASRASRRHTSESKSLSVDRIRGLIREHARREFGSEAFDLIVTGHVHVVDDCELSEGEKRFRSVNLGSWFDGAKVFVLSETRAEFAALDESR